MKVERMLPKVYYQESRDFSYIGRLTEVLFNYLKTNTDLVNSSINTIDSDDLLNSLAYTLGFKPKHKYINKDLINICSNFTQILKNKGTKNAIEQCVKILLNSQYITGDYLISTDTQNCSITIGLPSETQDIILLEDLFDYILPTGWIYNIVNIAVIPEYKDVYYFDENSIGNNPLSKIKESLNISQVSRPITIDTLIENISDITYDESTQGNLDKDNISRLWSGVVYSIDVNNSQEEQEGEEE